MLYILVSKCNYSFLLLLYKLSARELFGCMLVLGAVIAAQLMTTRQQLQAEGKECT